MSAFILGQVFSPQTSSSLLIFDDGKSNVPALLSQEPIFFINYLSFYVFLFSLIILFLFFLQNYSKEISIKANLTKHTNLIWFSIISFIFFLTTALFSFFTAQTLEEDFKNPPIFTALKSPGILSFTLEHRNYPYYLYTFANYKKLDKPIYKDDFRTAIVAKRKIHDSDITYCEVILISQSEIQSDVILNMLDYNHITECANNKSAIITHKTPRNLAEVTYLRNLKNEELSSNAK